MSGHNKWSTIKHKKGAADAKRGKVFTKIIKEISVAAKLGGADPAANPRLRTAIDKAKAENMPKDNIERAIKKGAGGMEGVTYEEIVYEGYGPGGIAIMVLCATDNRNRTAGDLRSYFAKQGGNMGETGCVGWMFKERAEIVIERSAKLNEEDLILAALDSGADDIDTSDEETVTVICGAQNLEALQTQLGKAGFKIASAEVTMAPSTTIAVTEPDQAKQLLRLLDSLENHDDVQHVYANFDMDTKLLQSLMS